MSEFFESLDTFLGSPGLSAVVLALAALLIILVGGFCWILSPNRAESRQREVRTERRESDPRPRTRLLPTRGSSR